MELIHLGRKSRAWQGLPLTGWTYRKSITLSRASGAVTDYQMKLLVGESSGATGEDVDCGGHCATDFDDIRFTTSDGTTLLDYWIESISGATPNQLATIWIEFDSIGTGETTFYMYYGAAAVAYSSGADTFIVFDDFERGSNGDEVGGSWTIVNHHFHISTTQKYNGTRSGVVSEDGIKKALVTLPVSPSDNISVGLRIFKPDAGAVTIAHGYDGDAAYLKWETDEIIYYYNGSTWVDSTSAPSHSAWHLVEINNFNWVGHSFDLWVDGTKKVSSASTFVFADRNDVLMYENRVLEQIAYIDCAIVRNFRATEPAWGAWGAEES